MEDIATVAVLIDAQGTDTVFAAKALDFADGVGSLMVTRAYGDWSAKDAKPWVESAGAMGLRLVQTEGGAQGAAQRIAVDAMKVLYTTDIDVVCIVSAKGDYTAVVTALRENGVYAIGVGTGESSEAFRGACSEFVTFDADSDYVPVEASAEASEEPVEEEGPVEEEEPEDDDRVPDEVRDAVLRVMRESDTEDGWVFLGGLARQVAKHVEGFNAREYGGMKEIAEKLGFFDFEQRAGNDGRKNLVFIRFKKGMRRSPPFGGGTPLSVF